MKTLLIFLTLTCFAFGQGTQITVLHTGDTHSHLDAFGPKDCSGKGTIGGIAKAATIIGTVKATVPNVLTLHAGDFFVGDFFFNKYFGVAELQIMKQIGYDALTVGNHEFDLGPEVLLGALAEGFSGGSFPLVSANLDLSGFPQLGAYVAPYTIKTIDGVDVGIFGMTIPNPLNNPDPVIVQENIPEIAYATVTAMRANGADVVIFLSHLGWGIDSSLAAGIPGIDFIVGGHDHILFQQPKSVTNPLGTQTLVMQGGPNYEHVGKLTFTYSGGVVTFDNYALIPVNATVPPVPEIQEVINYLKQGIAATYGNVYTYPVGYALRDIGRVPTNMHFKDSPIGNLVTDSYRNRTCTEIAITANGMISDILYRGKIVGADVLRTVPYGFDTTTGLGFNLVKMKIRGDMLIGGLEIGLSMIGIDNDFFLQVSGMKFRYDPDNPVGSRVIVPSVRINGKHLNPAKMYSITVNEGIFGILTSSGIIVEDVVFTGVPEYMALKQYISMLHFLNYKSMGRIAEATGDNFVIDEEESLTETIGSYNLSDNYPNPFNPSTKISYEIPELANVSLRVYDMSGREVSELVNQMQQPGRYDVIFNASSLSSGVYFYKLVVSSSNPLEAGEFVQTKKMILIK